MNWKKISEKYPKAFEKLKENYPDGFYPITRSLYDFFDEQEIYVSMNYEGDGRFQGDILLPTAYTRFHSFRRKAEEAIFKKAFKILEQKLN